MAQAPAPRSSLARSNVYQQQLRGERDARILEESGDYDDFDELVGHSLIDD